MTVSKITTPITPLEHINKTNEIIDNLGGGGSLPSQTGNAGKFLTTDGTDASWASALTNTATGTNALTILGTASTTSGATNVGKSSAASGTYSSAFGNGSTASGDRSLAIGRSASASGNYSVTFGAGAIATANYAIQIGYGTNSTASTLSVGFNASSSANRKNWQLLDGVTGLIPYARIPYDNSTITVNSNNQLQAISRNIGEIVTSTIPLTDAGLHLLDGALISGSGMYADFVTYIAGLVSDYPDIFETEANWQQSVTTYGVCGKFVYDSVNQTVRLPKITGIIEGTTDLTALGDLIEAGLPNITGRLTHELRGSDGWSTTENANGIGALNGTRDGTYALGNGSSGMSGNTINFDASRSNSIYGNSSTVQPQAIKVLYYIVVATTSKTDIQVDIDNITTDLNGKADTDLSNVPSSKAILEESYVNGTSWYRVYSDGWCEQGGTSANNGRKRITLLKNFVNTNYNALGCCLSNSRSNVGGWFVVDTKTVSSFYATIGYASGSVSTNTAYTYVWQASGYIR